MKLFWKNYSFVVLLLINVVEIKMKFMFFRNHFKTTSIVGNSTLVKRFWIVNFDVYDISPLTRFEGNQT